MNLKPQNLKKKVSVLVLSVASVASIATSKGDYWQTCKNVSGPEISLEASESSEKTVTLDYTTYYSDGVEQSLEFDFVITAFTGNPTIELSLLSGEDEIITSSTLNVTAESDYMFLQHSPECLTPGESCSFEYTLRATTEGEGSVNIDWNGKFLMMYSNPQYSDEGTDVISLEIEGGNIENNDCY